MQENSLSERIWTHIFVWAPWLALLAVIYRAWNYGVDSLSFSLFLFFVFVSGLGVTIGFHRLFTHRSFVTYAWVRYIFAASGMISAEMPLFGWVAFHRRHHKFSDEEGDPHSPHHHGEGWRGFLLGFWHSHTGWLFKEKFQYQDKYIPDLKQDKGLVIVNNLFPLWVVLGFVIPAWLGFIFGGTVRSTLLGFLWGGPVRLLVVYHLTWSVNSICHIWGSRDYETSDESRNNPVFGILGMGEGWHNNHHAFPTSARHGLRWWQFDLSYCIIRAMEIFGLAWKVRRPSSDDYARLEKRSSAA